MKTLTRYFLVACLPLLLIACDREAPQPVDQLPPATQEGANTFGCLVDGEVFLPKNDDIFRLPVGASYGYGSISGSVRVFAHNSEESHGIEFAFYENVFNPQSFYLTDTTLNPRVSYESNGMIYWANRGKISITALDTIQDRYISGTFWFDAINRTDATDSVRITDGRFDIAF